jgi:hypothetical protein
LFTDIINPHLEPCFSCGGPHCGVVPGRPPDGLFWPPRHLA